MGYSLSQIIGVVDQPPGYSAVAANVRFIFMSDPNPQGFSIRNRGDVSVSAEVTMDLFYQPPVPRGGKFLFGRRASFSASDYSVLSNNAYDTAHQFNGEFQTYIVSPPGRESWRVDLFFGPYPGIQPYPPRPPDYNPELVVSPPWGYGVTFPLVQDGPFLRGEAKGFRMAGWLTKCLVLLAGAGPTISP